MGVLLAISGGLMDSYSYMCRGQVFANAQTGNILLLSINLSMGNIPAFLQYLCPVAAFVAGIVLSSVLRRCLGAKDVVHWQRTVMLVEAVILFSVAFISMDLFANSLISLACGAQVESFQRIRGNSVATTMCIGNLRSAVHAAMEFAYEKEPYELKKAAIYSVIILAFAAGAVTGNLLVSNYGERAIWGSSALLLCSAILLTPLGKKSSS